MLLLANDLIGMAYLANKLPLNFLKRLTPSYNDLIIISVNWLTYLHNQLHIRLIAES